jgi:hypothetical protein
MGQTKFTDSTDVLPTFKSITDIHVESPEGVVCVVGEVCLSLVEIVYICLLADQEYE